MAVVIAVQDISNELMDGKMNKKILLMMGKELLRMGEFKLREISKHLGDLKTS
jgi:hypothetical protein